MCCRFHYFVLFPFFFHFGCHIPQCNFLVNSLADIVVAGVAWLRKRICYSAAISVAGITACLYTHKIPAVCGTTQSFAYIIGWKVINFIINVIMHAYHMYTHAAPAVSHSCGAPHVFSHIIRSVCILSIWSELQN
jgi:hypothetical protein